MHEHGGHLARNAGFGLPYRPNDGLGISGEGRFAYSPYFDCPVYDLQDIGTNFNCGFPRKAKVR
jgi:hypothetical protein